MQINVAIGGLWLAFALSWLAAALWSRPAQRTATFAIEAPYRFVLLLGAVLLAIPAHRYEGSLRLWHVTAWQAGLCVAAMAVGFGFCWGARIELGSLWSGRITRKADHRLVQSGPYAIVRHPIYTGLLLAVFATAAAKGTVLGIAGAAVMTLGFWLKARAEERWLMAELGAEEYEAYRRRVPMLVPWLG